MMAIVTKGSSARKPGGMNPVKGARREKKYDVPRGVITREIFTWLVLKGKI